MAVAPTLSPTQVASINAARDASVNAGQNAYQGAGLTSSYTSAVNNPVTPVVPANTISSTNLPAASGATTYQTYTAPSTASTGLTETALAAKDAALAAMSTNDTQLTADDAASKSTQQSILSKLGLEEENRQSQYQTAGVNQDQQDITDLSNDIDATNRSYTKQIEAVAANPQGRTDGGVDVVSNALKQQQASTLADKAILLTAKTNQLNTAKGIIDAQVDAETDDLKTQLSGLQYFYTQNEAKLTGDQKTQLQDKIDAAQNEYQDAKDTRTQINQLKLTAAQNGAPLSVLQAIGKATTVDDATAALGGYASDPLDRELKQVQLATAQQALKTSKNGVISVDVPGLVEANPGTKPADANSSAITAIASTGKITGTNQTNLGLILGVVDAAQQFASDNSSGQFAGINPLTGILNSKIPFTNIGLPFRNTVKSPAQVANEGYINGINLKVQQWASGASLSPSQTAQVEQFTPTVGDTDSMVKTKLNNLVNFMYNQAQGTLQSEGIKFTPAKVDLFADPSAQDSQIFDGIVGTGSTSTPSKVSLGTMYNSFAT